MRQFPPGGFGVVYEAYSIDINQRVALKQLIRSPFGNSKEAEDFRREASLCAKFRHPNVVQIYHFGTHQGKDFFAMEFADGGTLAAKWENKPQPATEVARTMEQVARGVQVAHESGVVHRDLKLANVLLLSGVPSSKNGEHSSSEWVPKVADFGLACVVEADKSVSAAGAGTPPYMAPEQVSKKRREIGPWTDVWALGVMLYQGLTRKMPFEGADWVETFQQIAGQEPVSPRSLRPGVPRDLETICLKCLDKEPGKRYRNAGELADDLRAYLESQPITARPAGVVERTVQWVRRNPVLSASAAVVMLALLVGTVVSTIFAVRAERRAEAEAIAKGLADERAGQLTVALGKVEAQRAIADERADAERMARETADRELDRAEDLLYISRINAAQRALDNGDKLEAYRHLGACRWDRRGWEHDHLATRFSALSVPLAGHSDWVNSVAFSPDGQRIASGSFDKTVRVWDASNGQELLSLQGHSSVVRSVAFSPDGKRIVSRDVTGKAIVWDAVTGQQLPNAPTVVADQSHSPDGRYRVEADGNNVLIIDIEREKRRKAYDAVKLARWAQPNPDWHRRMADDALKSVQPYAAAFHLERLALIENESATLVEAAHAWLAAEQPHRAASAFVQAILTDPHADLNRPAKLPILPEPTPTVMPKLR